MRIEKEHLELVKALQSILKGRFKASFTQSETVAYAISQLMDKEKI